MAKNTEFEDVIDDVDLMVDEYDKEILWKGAAVIGGAALVGAILGAAVSGSINYKAGFKDGTTFDPTKKK